MPEWYSVEADTRRQFSTLQDAQGAPLDLSGMTVQLRMAEATLGRRFRFIKDGVVVQSGAAPDLTDTGVVAFDPDPEDVAAVGEYLCQWAILDFEGKHRTVPDFQPFTWRISARIQ